MSASNDHLAAIYDAHAHALFGFVINLTRSEADTADILQEIFCRLARRPALLDRVSNIRAYLMRMAHSLVIDAIRHNRVREQHRDADSGCQEIFVKPNDPDEAAYRASLAAALVELPTDQRAVVHLKLWEEMTFEQIAQTLAISPNTAASRYRYGIDKLRTLLRPIYEELK